MEYSFSSSRCVFLFHGKNRWKSGSEEVVRAKFHRKSHPFFPSISHDVVFHLPSDKPSLFAKKNWQRLIPRVV